MTSLESQKDTDHTMGVGISNKDDPRRDCINTPTAVGAKIGQNNLDMDGTRTASVKKRRLGMPLDISSDVNLSIMEKIHKKKKRVRKRSSNTKSQPVVSATNDSTQKTQDTINDPTQKTQDTINDPVQASPVKPHTVPGKTEQMELDLHNLTASALVQFQSEPTILASTYTTSPSVPWTHSTLDPVSSQGTPSSSLNTLKDLSPNTLVPTQQHNPSNSTLASSARSSPPEDDSKNVPFKQAQSLHTDLHVDRSGISSLVYAASLNECPPKICNEAQERDSISISDHLKEDSIPTFKEGNTFSVHSLQKSISQGALDLQIETVSASSPCPAPIGIDSEKWVASNSANSKELGLVATSSSNQSETTLPKDVVLDLNVPEYGIQSAKTPEAATSSGLNTGKFSHDEIYRLKEGLELYGRNWNKLAQHISTRDTNAVRSHAQKYFIKLFRDCIPLPAKVFESGAGYTLSGKPLNPDSAAARPYLRGRLIPLHIPSQTVSADGTQESMDQFKDFGKPLARELATKNELATSETSSTEKTDDRCTTEVPAGNPIKPPTLAKSHKSNYAQCPSDYLSLSPQSTVPNEHAKRQSK
ncbi:hypothetical protein BASA50_008787 [Batrachochytrium salamandrivorans]|uniref:HTH myb-type domain-containing protein n=1 Tax=Batrachochytrium salamandrivorans TaxID=1357716 RepID=A0ABQ8F393_9FUNG|nr:hypothetical protein BASA60_002626 [Batrachochytrium salamandrivorans]KAH6591343.1 hypothetical protein BASA50_008787 [Batrachochytrium salamandrivorans]KAJ1342337.1 hypothetical protein BSLG_003096 [Batrachochytrium salamandrivorans]